MQFFIPNATTAAEGLRIYQAIKNHLTSGLDASFSDDKIAKIEYIHNGQNRSAVVGEVESLTREVVIAILYEPQRHLYHVCTPNRGVERNMSILVGEPEIRNIDYFEN